MVLYINTIHLALVVNIEVTGLAGCIIVLTKTSQSGNICYPIKKWKSDVKGLPLFL